LTGRGFGSATRPQPRFLTLVAAGALAATASLVPARVGAREAQRLTVYERGVGTGSAVRALRFGIASARRPHAGNSTRSPIHAIDLTFIELLPSA